MRFSTLLYTIKQGFANIFRNKWYSLASVATISACLFLFGIFYSVDLFAFFMIEIIARIARKTTKSKSVREKIVCPAMTNKITNPFCIFDPCKLLFRQILGQ